VWLLQHAEPEGPGAIAAALEARGVALRPVRPDRGEPIPAAPGDAAGLVVMGGPMGVYEADRFPHLRDELRLIAAALERGTPVLGICLGAQLLAATLGARVAPGPAREIGWHPVHLRPAARYDPLFAGVPPSFTAFHWHGDAFDLPAGATWLASSQRTPYQAFRTGAASYGMLFHLEVDERAVRGMVAAFGAELEAAGVDGRAVVAGAAAHLPALAACARTVFDRWAARLGRA
jgi:GMP synthase (glutamine-hydrolysing)